MGVTFFAAAPTAFGAQPPPTVTAGDNGNGNANGNANGNGNASGTLTIDPAALASGLAAASPPDGSTSDPMPPAPDTGGQSAASDATTKQKGSKNDNTSVRVDQGGGNGAVNQGNNASASASSNASGGGPKPGNGPGADASATSTQSAPTNTNIVVRVASPGDVGPVAQTNESSAAAAAAGSGTPDGSSAATSDAGSGTSATSSAGSGQEAPSNANVEVRVGSPGDSAPVSQSNTTQAGAASTSAGGGGDTAPDASASAAATQIAPGNVNVVIRVGSPGDNGPVTEQNSAGATAGPSLPAETPAPGSPQASAAATDQTVTTSGSASVMNTGTLDQQLDQVQSDADTPANDAGASTIGPDAPPATISSTGSAEVQQTGAANTNVSVRIASPGEDGPVRQGNGATATGTSPDLGVVVATEGANTNVAVVVPGTAAGAPDTGPWVWNWTWNGAWTPAAGAGAGEVAPTDAASWSWVWQSPPADAPPAGAPPVQPGDGAQASEGTWTWNWTWTRTDGQTWSGNWQRPCDCNWTWTWNWDWSAGVSSFTAGDTTAVESAPQQGDVAPAAATTDFGAVTQSNSAASSASASVTTSVVQSLDQSQIAADMTGAENQSITAEQTLVTSQDALAAAEAVQTDAANLVSLDGAATGSVRQENSVSATALADVEATIGQGSVQHQTSGTATVQSASSSQWLASAQTAIAASEATQTDARNVDIVLAPARNDAWIAPVEQMNSATATGAAAVAANLEQWIGQFQTDGLALAQGADATQLLGNSQTAAAAAVVAQTSTWNLNDVVVPAGSRAANPSVRQRNLVYTTSAASDSVDVSQWALQVQDGIAGVEVSSASQEAGSSQSALAYSPAEQTRLLNTARWLGVEPPAPGEPGVSPTEAAIAAGTAVIIVGPGSSLLPPRPLLPRLRPPPTVETIVAAFRPPPPVPPGAPAAGGAAGGAPASLGGGHARAARAAHDDGATPNGVAIELLSAGAAGSAPSGGGGAGFALAGRPFKLVAPAHLGPRTPAPTLGRSVDFFDPLERPG